MTIKAPTITARLAGVKSYVTPDEFERIPAGHPLLVSREPENPYHANAIRVDIHDQQVGHVDRGSADVVAPWMDKGWIYTCHTMNAPTRKMYRGEMTVDPRSVFIKLIPLRPICRHVTAPAMEEA